MLLIELMNLAVRSPTNVALPSLTHIGARDPCQTAFRVELYGEFVGDALVVHKPVYVCGADCRS